MRPVRSRQSIALGWLRRAAITSAAVAIVVAVALGASAAISQSDAASSLAEIKRLQPEAEALKTEIQRASQLSERAAPSDLSAVAMLRASVGATADRHECLVLEFRASSEVLPYLTRFAKDNTVEGWNQVEAQMLLRGSPRAVLATIAGMSDQNVPFEFNSIDISRDTVDGFGRATVNAKVSFRVLIRGGGSV